VSVSHQNFYNAANFESFDSPSVLKNVSLSISAGENIGICGRTGRQVLATFFETLS
jgi:ABC-type multidrug transport system fused ATPase/permease subunit